MKINSNTLKQVEVNIKIRKANEKDASKWFKFVNKVWRNAYKNIFQRKYFWKEKVM